jgi:hypothetical protein
MYIKVKSHSADIISMITNIPNATYWDPSPIRDRFFVARVDGQEKLFVLHADNTICITSASQPVTLESTEQLIGELRGLAA